MSIKKSVGGQHRPGAPSRNRRGPTRKELRKEKRQNKKLISKLSYERKFDQVRLLKQGKLTRSEISGLTKNHTDGPVVPEENLDQDPNINNHKDSDVDLMDGDNDEDADDMIDNTKENLEDNPEEEEDDDLDSEIRGLEKKLGLTGKKFSKTTLPDSFKNDGLDAILFDSGDEEPGFDMDMDLESLSEASDAAADHSLEEEEEEEDDLRNLAAEKSIADANRLPKATSESPLPVLNPNGLVHFVNGHLNRLSDETLLATVQDLGRELTLHSRREFFETVSTALLQTAKLPGMHSDKHIFMLGCLAAGLHHKLGFEFGAFLAQLAVMDLEYEHARLAAAGPLESEDPAYYHQLLDARAPHKLAAFIGTLCHFDVVYLGLLFDIIRKLVMQLHESDLEILVSLLQNFGLKIRASDPRSFRQIIFDVQERARDATVVRTTPRFKVLVELINDLKNNTASSRKNRHFVLQDDVFARMGKVINAIKKAKSGGEPPLSVGYQELLKADTQGKWWLIGSSWKQQQHGNKDLSNIGGHSSYIADSMNKGNTEDLLRDNKDSKRLIKLAKTYGMHTETKKHVFYIIMTCEDYLDAFEKLVRLNLNVTDQREIIKVLVDCTLYEKVYNPFYGHILCQFLQTSKHHATTFRYAAWDRFSDDYLAKISARQVLSLAKLLAFVLSQAQGGMDVLGRLELINLAANNGAIFTSSKQQVFLDLLLQDFFSLAPESSVLYHADRLIKKPAHQKLAFHLSEYIQQSYLKSSLFKSHPDPSMRLEIKQKAALFRTRILSPTNHEDSRGFDF